MSRKLLSKNRSSFLDSPLPENIQPIAKIEKKVRRFKKITRGLYQEKSSPKRGLKEAGYCRGGHVSKSRKDRIRRAEAQIVEQFFLEQSKTDITNRRIRNDHGRLPTCSQAQPKLRPAYQVADKVKDAAKAAWGSKAGLDGCPPESRYSLDSASPPAPARLALAGTKEVAHLISSEQAGLRPLATERQAKLPSQIPRTRYQDLYLLMSIEQIRNVLVSKRTQSYTYSEYKSQLRESRKIRFLYGELSKRELKKATRKAMQLYGTPGENLLVLLESRCRYYIREMWLFLKYKSI